MAVLAVQSVLQLCSYLNRTLTQMLPHAVPCCDTPSPPPTHPPPTPHTHPQVSSVRASSRSVRAGPTRLTTSRTERSP